MHTGGKSYASSHLHKNQDYDENFESRPGRKLMWALEREVLARILNERRFSNYLDFACGTGRIISEVGRFAEKVHGMDVSESMLKVARKKCPNATYFEADVRESLPELAGKQFDLITAFRFFSNAERDLRQQAIKFLSGMLSSDGLMIVNNHRNLDSFSYGALRLTGREFGRSGMTDLEMRELAGGASLRIEKCYSLGLLPQSENRSILPWRVTGVLEHWSLRAIGDLHRKGYNLVYVLAKTN